MTAALAVATLVTAALASTTRPAASSPHRIISLIPAVTEMLFAIGAGPDVVAVSSYDHFPPEATTRPRVGALVDPDVERILSLRPDLVIVYGTQTSLIAHLQAAHVPMFTYEHAGLADITATLRAIGARVGHAADANRLAAGIEHDLAGIRARVAGLPRPKTLLVFGREPGTLRGIEGSGGVGFLHDMLEVAGGDDVFADVKRQSVQPSIEQILARAPDVIIEIRVGAQVPHDLDAWNALPSLPAVRNHRIHLLTDEMLVIPGPRVAMATRMLAALVHPERFNGGQ